MRRFCVKNSSSDSQGEGAGARAVPERLLPQGLGPAAGAAASDLSFGCGRRGDVYLFDGKPGGGGGAAGTAVDEAAGGGGCRPGSSAGLAGEPELAGAAEAQPDAPAVQELVRDLRPVSGV